MKLNDVRNESERNKIKALCNIRKSAWALEMAKE
jgi:hypothetical protein